MTYQKWDKQTKIYDLTPEQIMANNSLYRDEDSYVFYGDDGRIFDILPLSQIPNPNGYENVEDILNAYIGANEPRDFRVEEILKIMLGVE